MTRSPYFQFASAKATALSISIGCGSSESYSFQDNKRKKNRLDQPDTVVRRLRCMLSRGLRELFSHFRQEAGLLEIPYSAAGNQRVKINFLNLRVHASDDPANESPDLGVRSDLQARHLLARDSVRSFDVFILAQAEISFQNFHN